MELTFNNPAHSKLGKQALFKSLLTHAASLLVLPDNCGLSINLVSANQIRQLNRQHRGHNQATDVLSFPLQKPFNISKLKSGAILELGDIFICPAYLQQHQDPTVAGPRQQLMRLVIHGLLHLLGYDHAVDSVQAKTMFTLEKKNF